MTEIKDMGFTELIQQPESHDRDCERRLRLNTLSAYLGRISCLDYVPEDCFLYNLTLPPRPPFDYEPVERAQAVQDRIKRSMAARGIQSDASARIAHLQPARDFHSGLVRQTLSEFVD